MLGRPHAISLAALLLVVSAGLLGGCSGAKTSSESSDPLASAVPAKLTMMTPAEKTSQIATSFPMQVPVPVGTVERGQAQGPTAWDYTIVVPGDVTAVERWYFDVYSGAEWTVVSRSADSMALQKNRAQTQLRFTAVEGKLSKTRIVAAVGIGTQVLQTQ